jgi:phosphatidylinositol alpha-1,6-mannosyltransferase
MARPRVLVVTPDFSPGLGGIQKLMHELVSRWSRVEPRVVTLAEERAPVGDRPAEFSIRRVAVAPGMARKMAVSALNLAAFTEGFRFRPDVVLSGHLVVSPAARGLQRLRRLPYVQYLYGSEVARRPDLARFALSSANSVVAISSFTEQLALSCGARPERIVRIPPGVDSARSQTGATGGPSRILTISRLDERYKGQDVLIRALPLVRSRLPEARLVVIGDGDFRPYYEGLATALGVAQGVTFLGAADEETKCDALRSSHVFAMPSRMAADGGGEGFGIVYLEAGVYGLPVVAGKAGGAADAVVHQETGVLVDATDHVEVADAIYGLLSQPQRAKAMGQAGAQRASAYTWTAVARQVEDVLLELAEKR